MQANVKRLGCKEVQLNRLIFIIVLMLVSLPACTGSTDNINNVPPTVDIPGVDEGVGLGICAGFYKPDFTPVTGDVNVVPSASLQNKKPTKGVRYTDPLFKTCVTRATDWQKDNVTNFAIPFYARSQAFNADSTKFIVVANDGFWHLYNTEDLSHIRRVSLGGFDVEVNWHSTNPDILYRMPMNGGLRIFAHDISDPTDRTAEVAADFTNVNSITGYPGAKDIRDVWEGATRFYTASEGSPSADGRYWALLGVSENFNTAYGIIVYDMQANSIVGVYDFATNGGGVGGPNNVTMSPNGNYVVAIWGPENTCRGSLGSFAKPCGTMAFNRTLSSAKGITMAGEHGDTAIGMSGKDVYIAVEYDPSGTIQIFDLETGNLISRPYTNTWEGAMHFSGKAFNKPGWVIMSTYGQTSNNGFDNRIVAISLSSDPQIINLAHHYTNAADYNSQPHATVNRQGTKILFGSSWGTAGNADTYLISLPSSFTDL